MDHAPQASTQPASHSALKVMLYGMLGIVIGLAVTFGVIYLLTGALSRDFVIFALVVCVPLTLLYLWTHRSPDNTRFKLE